MKLNEENYGYWSTNLYDDDEDSMNGVWKIKIEGCTQNHAHYYVRRGVEEILILYYLGNCKHVHWQSYGQRWR